MGMAVFQHIEFPSIPALQLAMGDCLCDCFQRVGTEPFAVMLSGGKTPLDIYAAVIRRGLKAVDLAHIFYSDERAVPETSDENNYHHTVALLQALQIPDTRVFRVHTGQALVSAGAQYHQELHRFIGAGGRLALGMLGIGPDGHTASLFSLEDIRRGAGRYAVDIPHEPGPDRISVTPALLARVERLILLAAGPEKREIVAKLLHSPEAVVAGQALRQARCVEIWQA
jgi:6-phosphogluconolactonase/glucosamine-6-phosphate isomerase/deaminase